ncbi:MAG: creatininase family protein [Pyrinomonadaceae bacterium]
MKHIWLLFSLAIFTTAGQAQVLRLAEMNSPQIAALDRQKTVVILPGGTMEEHGPYLPSFTDGYMNEWWADRLAEAVVKRSGWTAVIYPTIPLGDGGANEIGFKYTFPGTYGVRLKTLRSVYMDLGTELGEQGFRWMFIIQNHGSPLHNFALDQAGDFFHDTYGGQMVNLFGLEPVGSEDEASPAAEFVKENGIDIHAGLSETSRILFIRPNLVDAAYSTATPFTILNPEDFSIVAARPDWLGYFGTPRRATAAYGRHVMEYRSSLMNKTALSIVDGADPKKIKRYADQAMKEEATVVAGGLKYDASVEKKQQNWIKRKGLSW